MRVDGQLYHRYTGENRFVASEIRNQYVDDAAETQHLRIYLISAHEITIEHNDVDTKSSSIYFN